jgi:hypothetical protein
VRIRVALVFGLLLGGFDIVLLLASIIIKISFFHASPSSITIPLPLIIHVSANYECNSSFVSTKNVICELWIPENEKYISWLYFVELSNYNTLNDHIFRSSTIQCVANRKIQLFMFHGFNI